MNNVEVLIIHGSPGSGKTTFAGAVSEILRQANISHAVIDPDEISKIFPTQDNAFSKKTKSSMAKLYCGSRFKRNNTYCDC